MIYDTMTDLQRLTQRLVISKKLILRLKLFFCPVKDPGAQKQS